MTRGDFRGIPADRTAIVKCAAKPRLGSVTIGARSMSQPSSIGSIVAFTTAASNHCDCVDDKNKRFAQIGLFAGNSGVTNTARNGSCRRTSGGKISAERCWRYFAN
jgi:hypothetical protein